MFPQISHLASYSIAVQEYLSVLQQVKQAIKKQKKRPISELHCIGIKLKHLYVEVVFSQMGLVEAWGSGWICG